MILNEDRQVIKPREVCGFGRMMKVMKTTFFELPPLQVVPFLEFFLLSLRFSVLLLFT